MIPILLTTTNEKQPDAVLAWDPLGGNPVAALSGEMADRNSLTVFADYVMCAAVKKPFLQLWNFQSASSNYKRVLTKGVVSALAFSPDNEYLFLAFEREVYVYQVNSGCLVGVLEGTHSAKIGELKLSSYCSSNPSMLISADTSGFLACWSLAGLMDELSLLCSSSSPQDPASCTDSSLVQKSDHKISPLWYLIQTSNGLPRIAFSNRAVLVAGSEGLKMVSLLDGTLLSIALSEVSGGLHSLCTFSGRIFCGGLDGLLYSVYLSDSETTLTPSEGVRPCFRNSKLSTLQKTITELAWTPTQPGLLIVGALCGYIEVLRTDSLLTCLRQFSVLNSATPIDTSTPSQLTGLCLVPRPDWLSGGNSQSTAGLANITSTMASDASSFDQCETDTRTVLKASCGLEPLKRHFGWRYDDLVKVRLPSTFERTNISSQQTDIYMDDFYEQITSEVSETVTNEVTRLQNEITKLTAANRKLLRNLIEKELRS